MEINKHLLKTTLDVKASIDDDDDDDFGGKFGQGSQKKPDGKSKTPVLDTYSRDLTKYAEEGKLDPIIGRDKEIERVSQILSRRKKNNPILIGEAGVGKSSIAEGLALRITQRNVSRVLFDKRVVMSDLAAYQIAYSAWTANTGSTMPIPPIEPLVVIEPIEPIEPPLPGPAPIQEYDFYTTVLGVTPIILPDLIENIVRARDLEGKFNT
jgi:hypothetical protein